MSTARLIAWNTGVQAVGKIISTIFGVAIIAFMTRYLGTEGFGFYSTANAFFQIFVITLDLGINVMIVQILGEHKGDEKYENRAVSATMTLRIILSLVFLTLAPLAGLFFPYDPVVKVALFAIWGSFFTASLNQIVIGVQQRHLKMHMVAISEVAGRAFLFFGMLLAMYLGWGLIPIVIMVSLGSALNLIINWWAARKYASFKWNWDPEFWKMLIGRSWPIGVSIIFNLAYFKADTFVMSLVRPANEVGIYSAAYRVLEIAVTFPFMLAGVMLPLMSHAWVNKDLEKFTRLVRQSFSAMMLLAIPLAAGTIVMGVPVMTFISGAEYLESGQILKVLAIAISIIYVGTISSHVVVAINAQRKMLPIYAVVAIITVLGYILLIPKYGMWAAAWLTVASEVAVAGASTYFSLKAAPRGFSVPVALKLLFAGGMMALAILPLKNFWLPIPIITGILVYSVLVLLTGAVSKETLKELFSPRL